MAMTDFAEAPACEERLGALKRLRALREPRALPMLREATRIGLSTLFGKDKNECLRTEAQATIAELEKLSQPPAQPPS
jgi:hypothetical protein